MREGPRTIQGEDDLNPSIVWLRYIVSVDDTPDLFKMVLLRFNQRNGFDVDLGWKF